MPPYRFILALCTLVCGLLGLARPSRAAAVPVATTAQLIAAVQNAKPGDVISLAPGTYDVGQTIYCVTPGTAAQPIVVRAATLGTALLRVNTVEGIKVAAPHWSFENLDVQGICAVHSDCEHAFHIVGPADFTHLRNCRLHDFNAEVKGNGEGNPPIFPNDVVIEDSELFDSAIRDTANPVTPIDVVGGRRWVIRANFIHDHAKGQGDQISYAAFLKGNSRDGLFERNLVICERDTTGGVRLGLSFGGGGSSPPSICEDGTCIPEHQNGTMRNNVIVNCSQDVGIYLNSAANTRIYDNTLYDTTGIDVRFPASTADLRNNLLSGQIRNRDGGTSTKSSNLELVSLLQFATWFLNPVAANFALLDGSQIVNRGEPLLQVTDDFCAHPRTDGAPDLGAVEYGPGACNTAKPGGGVDVFRDGFESGGWGEWVVP